MLPPLGDPGRPLILGSKSLKKSKHGFINGPFYPWMIEMGNSQAMRVLRKNANAVNVFSMFISKYSKPNDGKNLSLTYSEIRGIMSPFTFAKAKFWCTALGFLHCTRFGRLERNASLYDLSSKWKHLSNCPEKLGKIEKLLHRYDKVTRIPAAKLHGNPDISAKSRKRMCLRRIEKVVLGQ